MDPFLLHVINDMEQARATFLHLCIFILIFFVLASSPKESEFKILKQMHSLMVFKRQLKR